MKLPSFLSRKKKATTPAPARLTTHDEYMAKQRRFFLTVTALMGLLCLCCIFVALVAFARPMPVVMWDRSDGQAVLVSDTRTPRIKLQEWQIGSIAKQFVGRFVGFWGPTARRDMAEAANMMTERFRTIFMADEASMKLVKKRHQSNIRAQLIAQKVHVGRYDPDNLGGQIHVIVTATRQFEPIVGDGRPVTDYVLVKLVLQRVPISPQALLGLQVDFAEVQDFSKVERLNAAMAALSQSATLIQ